MSYINSIEIMKKAVTDVGLGLHYEDDATMQDLTTSVASDFDGTVLFSNDGGGEPYRELFERNSTVSVTTVTMQIACSVTGSRTKTDSLLEKRMQKAIEALILLPNGAITTDIKKVYPSSRVEKRGVASATKIVGEVDLELVYSNVPSPLVLYTCEGNSNGDTTIENAANAWFTKDMTLLLGATASNAAPLTGTLSIDFDGVNDYGDIPADHADLLDFKVDDEHSICFKYRHNGAPGTSFMISRGYALGTYFFFSWSGVNQLRLALSLPGGQSYNHYYEVTGDLGASPISLVDGSIHYLGLSYDGSGSMLGYAVVADGVPMTLVSSSYYASDPTLDKEMLVGTELEADIRYQIGGSPAGFRTDCTIDDLAFFGEKLETSHFLQIATGTAPDALV